MKKQLLYTVLALLAAHLCTAQVLYSENFDNLAIGDLSTDPTGTTAGQGGWYVNTKSNNISNVRIEAEPGRGKVLLLEYPGGSIVHIIEKKDLNIDWSQRISSNQIIKVEYDFFTGNEPSENYSFTAEFSGFRVNLDNQNNSRALYDYRPYPGVLLGGTYFGVNHLGNNNQPLTLTKNSWVRLVMYLDYSANKIHYVIPSLGVHKEEVLIYNAKLPVTIDNYRPVGIDIRIGDSAGSLQRPAISMYDAVAFSAVNQVSLNIEEVLASKLNIFPNPVTDVVTITHNENIGIEEVTLYGMNGKIVKLQKSNNESEIQLNVESFETGTYLLHIKTKEGTAIKKVVKK